MQNGDREEERSIILDDAAALLDGFDWLHLSGITPALGPSCAACPLCPQRQREQPDGVYVVSGAHV